VRDIVWTALLAAMFLILALFAGVAAMFRDDWMLMAFAGIGALAGIGFASLSQRSP
jgi:hypothetical protein